MQSPISQMQCIFSNSKNSAAIFWAKFATSCLNSSCSIGIMQKKMLFTQFKMQI